MRDKVCNNAQRRSGEETDNAPNEEGEEAAASGGQDQIESELHEPMPEHEKQSDKEKRKTGGSLRPQRRNRSFQEASAEVQSDAQA